MLHHLLPSPDDLCLIQHRATHFSPQARSVFLSPLMSSVRTLRPCGASSTLRRLGRLQCYRSHRHPRALTTTQRSHSQAALATPPYTLFLSSSSIRRRFSSSLASPSASLSALSTPDLQIAKVKKPVCIGGSQQSIHSYPLSSLSLYSLHWS